MWKIPTHYVHQTWINKKTQKTINCNLQEFKHEEIIFRKIPVHLQSKDWTIQFAFAVISYTKCFPAISLHIHCLRKQWMGIYSQYESMRFSHLMFLPPWYTHINKNPSAWNFLSPKPEVTCGTVAIIIRVILLSPYLRVRAVSLSSIHYNQSHRVYINRRRQYICLIWN